MKTTTIKLSDDYLLHVTVQQCKPEGHCNIRIQSQWLGAKDPNGLQTRYEATIPRQAAFELAATLIEGA